ncbi:MAG: carboxypeptidase-like regulatory domain-containing protein [Candidatus Caldarchaeum sp.]
MIGKSQAVLLALLLALPTAFLGAAVLTTQAQTTYSAWLKIVTDSWDGEPIRISATERFATPVNSTGIDFPGRYNATNVCVELYRFKNPVANSTAPLTQYDGPISAGSPNGTGFIRVSWPAAWENVTIIVKAKSYQGDCIGAGSPFSGIIVYWLTINATQSFRNKFGINFANSTIGDDGIEQDATTGNYFGWTVDAPFNAGPIDVVAPKNPASWGADFQADHNDPYARNAWVAHAAYIFKLFHEHTWYSTNDVLTYATIFIYDTDHTSASSTQSLIQAAITGDDGQSRYTREIYPRSQGVGTGKFAQNRLVPIPLQSINLAARTPFRGGIPAPNQQNGNIQAPHLNATKRVWWETVLTNQTFYVGNEYNGTGGTWRQSYALDAGTGKQRPLFGAFPADPSINPTITQGGITGVPAGPFSLVHNHTVPVGAEGLDNGQDRDPPPSPVENVANFNNNTVFYARFCVQDADLKIQHPEVGDKLVGAEVTVNFKTVSDTPYYLSHNILETDGSGCTATPHKWPGYLRQFSNFARFPNGTNWGLRGSLNVSKHFDPRHDLSPVWRPGGYFERAWGGDWRGPWINAGRNWSALIPEITYMKTRQLSDDLNWDGFDVQVKWKGGSRNSYGGQPVLVDSIRVKNPYAIAALYNYEDEDIFGGWVFPYTELANNKFWLMIHKAAQVDISGDTIYDPNPTWLEIMGPFSLVLTGFDSTTGTFDITITADGPLVVNNATDPDNVVDWTLEDEDDITIEDALVSFKKHDITEFFIAFEAGQGQADRGADGRDDYTTVDSVVVSGGPFEVEFWPGPPGSGTVRALISGHDVNVCILPNNLNTCPNIPDFTGALLVKGPPRVVEFAFYVGLSDDVSGMFETTQGPATFDYRLQTDGFPSGTIAVIEDVFYEYLQWAQLFGASGLTIEFPATNFLGVDFAGDGSANDSVRITASITIQANTIDLHYAWREDFPNAFTITGGTVTAQVDINADGSVENNFTCTVPPGVTPGNVRTYRDPDTGQVTITATAPATLTCTNVAGANAISLSGRDAANEDMDVSLNVVFTITATASSWPPASLTSVSGSATVTGQVDFDDGGVNNFLQLPLAFGRNIGASDLGSFNTVDQDAYTDTLSFQCTVSGTIPPTIGGTTLASVSCVNGVLSLTIDIHGNGPPAEVSLSVSPLTASGNVLVTRTGTTTITITGTVTISPSIPGLIDLDNDGVAEDSLTIRKTLYINVSGDLVWGTPNYINVTSQSHVLDGVLNININNAPPNDADIQLDGRRGGFIIDELTPAPTGTQVQLNVPPTTSAVISAGQALVGIRFFDTAAEQVLVSGAFEFTATVQVGANVYTVEGYGEFEGLGSIDNSDRLEGSGAAFFVFFGDGIDVLGSGTFEIICFDTGQEFTACWLSITWDGTMNDTLPASGTLVLNNIDLELDDTGSAFATLDEAERLRISGTIPEGGNNLVVGGTTYTDGALTLNGGILSVGPIVKAMITDALFSGSHQMFLGSLFEDMTLSGTAIDTTINGIPVVGEQDFSIELTGFPTIDITSFVVPLPDIGVDNQHLDDKLFGGYDDFALTGTGMVYITAWVHDVAWKIVDNMGNTLPAANTDVTLTRGNGPAITRSHGSNPDQFQGNLAWSYSQWAGAETGYAIFYQLPGDQAYGLVVTFEGQKVYSATFGDDEIQIEKLVETVIDKVVANVFKLKLVFIDCENKLLDSAAYVKITSTSGFTYSGHISDQGALDFGMVAGGELTVHGLWWKGIWVPFTSAKIGDRELTLTSDGKLVITLDRNIDAPITLTALINNIIITPWDFNMDVRIPRLNITLSWVGVHPLTGRRMYFVETLDPTGDSWDGDGDGYARNDFNTSLDFSQFFKYKVEYRQGQEKSYDNSTRFYNLVEYIFYKMPPTMYNITVTTVADMWKDDGKTGKKTDEEDWVTPGTSKWPGRNEVVDYEVKTDWTSHSSPPTIRKTPADIVNDRVVLRVYGTIGGRPVDDPDLNPGGVGNQTFKTCGPIKIDLLTWAHNFYKRVVDGDFDYLNDARRIGNATFYIRNDNGRNMEHYDPVNKVWVEQHTSKWTEDLFNPSRIKSTSEWSSTIWWNGSYLAYRLEFYDYVYPLEFTRGEQPWARFYDKVGLTGAGWLTTEQGPLDDDNDPEATPTYYQITEFFNVTSTNNGKSPTHNFTVVGNEGLWNQQRWRWESAVARGNVSEVPTRPYSLVFEKQVVTFPIPVGFITLSLKDEDLARAIPYAVVQLDVYARTGTVEIPPNVCPTFVLVDRVAEISALIIQTVSNLYNGIDQSDRNDPALQPNTITDNERGAIKLAIISFLTDSVSPNVIDDIEDDQLMDIIWSYTGSFYDPDNPPGIQNTPWVAGNIEGLVNLVKEALLDDCVFTEDEKDDLIAYIDDQVLPITVDEIGDPIDNDGDEVNDADELRLLLGPFQLPPARTLSIPERYASYLYKTGRDGNLTLLFPTQEAMENILGAPVFNYTLTVYWYLNSSIVYKDAFNLTKRGYSVDKVAIADVTFVLAISADKDRPVKDLYARIWWFNVTDGRTTFPGRIAVDHAKKTWTYTAVPETRGAAKWTEGRLTLPWLPTSERFTKSDWDLVYKSDLGRWEYEVKTRSWDIPYPSYSDGSMLAGWPYSPRPTGYYRALNYTENARIQYRISVWSDQLPIDPSSPALGKGAWSRAAPAAAVGDHYELVWTRLSTGDTTPPIFRFAWMLFGHDVFNMTWYRGADGTGDFEPIPGYALTKTSERTPAPGSKVVAIKLNATDIEIPVFWQVGDYELGTYDCGPLVGYRVRGQVIPPAGARFPAFTFDRTTTAGRIRVGDKAVDVCIVGKDVGLIETLKSGDTPDKVFWGGSTLRIAEVSPPERIWADSTTPARGKGTWSDYWKTWVGSATDPVTGKKVDDELVVGNQTSGSDLGIQYMGYGTPFEGEPREVKVVAFSNDPGNRAHRPFIKMFEFQNVSARITDFNGRPLPGAFYQIVDAQTGKSAAWSYAGPDGRIIPMPIRKPGGVFIQRVLYLGHGANGTPTWPVNSFTRWPIAYDSRDDETTQETQKPDIPLGFAYTAEAGPWPNGPGWRGAVCRLAGDGVYNYVRATLEALASCPPSGWGRSFDVITRIFDLRVRFVYGDAQKPVDPAYVFTAPSLGLPPDQFTIRGQGYIFEAKRLARSTYDIVAYWPNAQGQEVGRRTFDISRANVGTVEGTVVLALRDVSFTVVDRQGRILLRANVNVAPNLMRPNDTETTGAVYTLFRMPDGITYTFTVDWTSPYGTTARATVIESPQGLQNRGSITVLVDDVIINVVDFDDRPVAGAEIRFGGQDVGKTDSQGAIIIRQVPLDNTYAVTVSKEGTQIGSDNIRFTSSRTSATLQAGIYDITVLVKGAAGQPIQGAIVQLVKDGAPYATVATDSSGTAVFAKVVGADYSVKATYDVFSSSANLAKGTRSTTITLDLYTVLLGVPMSFAMFLALIIGLILLIIVVVVVVSEYIRWRGRRLGIYPAAPPKK